MARVKFFALSSFVALLALSSQLVWMRHASQSLTVHSMSIHASEVEQQQARAQSSQLLQRGQPFWYSGICFAAVSFVLWLLCLSRREPVWRLIPFALLVCYALLLMVMI